MKRLVCTILSMLLMLSLVSCGSGGLKFSQSEYISSEPLALSGLKIGYEADSLTAYKNIVFALDEGRIERIDLLTGERVTILEGSAAVAIGCDGAHFAALSEDKLSVYDYDGNLFSELPLEEKLSDIRDVSIYQDKAAFSTLYKIYHADLAKKQVTPLPDTWKAGLKDAEIQKISLADDGKLLVSVGFNYGLIGWDFRVIEYDIADDVTVSQYDSKAGAADGCFSADGEYYYVGNYGSGLRGDETPSKLVSKIDKDGGHSNVMVIDNDGLKKLGIEPKNIYVDSIVGYIHVADDYSLEYADGESFVLWNETAGTVSCFNSVSGDKPLVILIPHKELSTSMTIVEKMAIEYYAKTGRQIVMRYYDIEEYSDRIRTKLLAGEADFDIFVSDSILLPSIIENEAYEPLDGYKSLTDNFDNHLADGVRELMTADGGLFGVPLQINFWGCLEQASDYNVPTDWTAKELFEFCEQIPEGRKLCKERFVLTRTVVNYIEDMVCKDGNIDKEELSQFLGKLRDYNSRGVLCDGDSEPILTYGIVFFNALNLEINEVDDRITTIAPTRSGIKYLEIENTLLVNRNSENKEAAAEFLSLMTSEDIIYNNDEFETIIGKDVKKNSCYSGLSDSKKKALEYSMTMYQNAKPSKLSVVGELPQFIAYEIVAPIFDGEITPEEAADKVIDEVAYTYFE